MPPTSAVLLTTSLALLYLVLRSRVAAVDVLAFQRLKSWEPQVAAALAAAVLARAAAATDAVARVAPGGRLAGAPRMAVACGITLLATAGGQGGIGLACAAWLFAAAASAALLWSWDEREAKDDDDDDDDGEGGATRRNSSRRSTVVEMTPAALAQELDAEAEASRKEARAAGKEGKSNSSSNNKDSSPLISVLFYDPRGGSRAAAVCAAFDVLSEEEEGEDGEEENDDGNREKREERERPLVLYRRLNASRWPDAAAELGVRWEGGGGNEQQQPSSLPALALFRGGEVVASAPGEGGRLPANVGGLRRALRV